MTSDESQGLGLQPKDHLYMIFRFGHKPIPEVRYVTSQEEVRETLGEMFFGRGIKQSKQAVDGLVDYFNCPSNWWCGVMEHFKGETDGGIGAVQLRRK